MNQFPSSSKADNLDYPQQQCRSGRSGDDGSNAECSQGEKCESSQRKSNEGVPDEPTDTSLRFSHWNDELGFLASKRVQEMFKSNYSDEGSLSINHNFDSRRTEGDSYQLPQSIPEQSSIAARSSQQRTPNDINSSNAIAVPGREVLLLSEVFARLSRGGVGGVPSRSHVSSNLIPPRLVFNSLRRYWTSRGLHDVIRSSSIALEYTSNNANMPSQVGQTSLNSFQENRPHNEVDLLRQHYEQSVLFVQMFNSGAAEGSFSLRITAGNARQRDQGILLLGQSPLFNIVNLHDRYQDMRLDVENMSYEELLALEDRIGYVTTGLSEEAINELLKHRKYFLLSEENVVKESCSICQEDCVEEDDLGILSCGHGFHHSCVKQWLRCKNVCPVCKSTGLTSTSELDVAS